MRTSSARGRRIGFLLMLTGGLLLSGCASETLFRSSFSQNAMGAPPAVNQAIGTITVGGTPGNVGVVGPPTNATPPQPTDNWAQISRARGPGNPVNVMMCHLTPFRGEGSYSLLAVLTSPAAAAWRRWRLSPPAVTSPPPQGNFGFCIWIFWKTIKCGSSDDNAQVSGRSPGTR